MKNVAEAWGCAALSFRTHRSGGGRRQYRQLCFCGLCRYLACELAGLHSTWKIKQNHKNKREVIYYLRWQRVVFFSNHPSVFVMCWLTLVFAKKNWHCTFVQKPFCVPESIDRRRTGAVLPTMCCCPWRTARPSGGSPRKNTSVTTLDRCGAFCCVFSKCSSTLLLLFHLFCLCLRNWKKRRKKRKPYWDLKCFEIKALKSNRRRRILNCAVSGWGRAEIPEPVECAVRASRNVKCQDGLPSSQERVDTEQSCGCVCVRVCGLCTSSVELHRHTSTISVTRHTPALKKKLNYSKFSSQ